VDRAAAVVVASIVTEAVIEAETATAVANVAEAGSRVAGSQTRIIAIARDSRASRAGNTQQSFTKRRHETRTIFEEMR
jgi:hypothetical protein